MANLFNNLESSDPLTVEESKKDLTKTFSQTKDSWVVFGMMDYFSNTNSVRIVDVLVKVQMPHDNYIFDKLLEWVHSQKRNQAFNLFWHIVKKHPSWLHKVATHPLFREILKVLKTESNITTAMNALFCVIILLPIIPTSMPQYLSELFETFMYLASWKAKNKPELTKDQQIHLQIGISTLFQRLYGMFPCNFTFYIRDHIKENQLAYENVINPLLETVKMHPLLLTSNRESEKSVSRWKEMEPHDVVIECSRFSFEGVVKLPDIECEHQNENTWYNQLMTDTASNLGIGDVLPMCVKQRVKNTQKLDCIWSPSNAVLATPPPTNTVTHTPTPTMINPNYTIQTISSAQYTSSGASPPEAAVEATPETTPMKDFIKPHRPFPVNSTAVRTIWANTSQPSSPRKKEDGTSIFGYTENSTSTASTALLMSSKLTRLVSDRQMAKLHHERNVLSIGEMNSSDVFEIEIQDPLNANVEICQEDEEVTEINKGKIGTDHFGEPVSFGNGDSTVADVRAHYTPVQQSIKNDETANNTSRSVSNKRLSSSWPGLKINIKDANAAATDLSLIKETVATQTNHDENVPIYQNIAQDMLSDEINRRKSTSSNNNSTTTTTTMAVETVPISPHLLLDQYIEASIKKQSPNDVGSHRTVELQLLYLQLQYERYRREVHAERNRRLLGKSRDNAALKMDNDKLRYQSDRLSKELTAMTVTLNDAKLTQNAKQQENFHECERLRNEIHMEQTNGKELRLEMNSLKRALTQETEQNKEISASLGAAHAEIFDLKNLLRQSQDQADAGNKHKEELQRMYSKEVLMGELQIKLNEKMIELSNLRARDGETEALKQAYIEEVRELQSALDSKSSQLSTAEERLVVLQSQLSRRDSLLADHKRNLQTVKDEYEEKLKAVEAKYAAQKAVVLRLEESILELYKMKTAGGLNMILPEPDKTDMVGSLDHTSPLSMSLASSEGLSLSLRSVPDIKNLSHLVSENTTATTSLFSHPNGVSISSEKSKQIVSDDIPVPSSSHSHYYQ